MITLICCIQDAKKQGQDYASIKTVIYVCIFSFVCFLSVLLLKGMSHTRQPYLPPSVPECTCSSCDLFYKYRITILVASI